MKRSARDALTNICPWGLFTLHSSVIPALAAGIPPSPTLTLPSPIHSSLPNSSLPSPIHSSSPNSSLPPSRGEVRWGVRGPARPPAPAITPITHPHPHFPQLPLRSNQNRSADHAPLPTTTSPRRQPGPDQR